MNDKTGPSAPEVGTIDGRKPIAASSKAMAEFSTLRVIAVSDLVKDQEVVAMEGFTHLILGAGPEIIRQQKVGLTLVRMTPNVLFGQLIGTGCATTLVFSWGGDHGSGLYTPKYRSQGVARVPELCR